MWAAKLFLILVLAYFFVLVLIFFAQTALLFPSRMVGAAPPLPTGAARLTVEAEGGELLHGVHIAPERKGYREEKTAILGFGGNAWNAESVAAFLHDLYPDADIVAFHYRGYRPSGGTASAAALLADPPLLYDHVAARLRTRRIVAVGFSIGSGVAANLASRRPLTGLILVTPFDSLEALAGRRYRWLPIALLLRHRMSPIEDLRNSTIPTALIAAGRDTLIPPSHAQALASALPNPVLARTVPDAGHNDIYQNPRFRQAMTEALARIEAAAQQQ